MSGSFSKRLGFSHAQEAEIKIRESAPQDLRDYLLHLCFKPEVIKPSALRKIICHTLKQLPDEKKNWTEHPNVADEVQALLQGCRWYKVYDIIEHVLSHLRENQPSTQVSERFQDELNEYFVEHGIGWKIVDGRIEARGPESFEAMLRMAKQTEHDAGHTTAATQLHHAIEDLSRRHDPDPSGAIQHAMVSLECVARQLTGDAKATLGDILKRHESLIPTPLDTVVKKAWGYASENGRHMRQGKDPSYYEAELIVGLCASISSYLIQKARHKHEDDLHARGET